MKTANLDIVYCLKNSLNNEELRYSLRSLVNLPHRNIWIIGGKPPKWVKNVYYLPFEQKEESKWMNTRKMLELACNTPKISTNFMWFNDDFFILRPIVDLQYHTDRTLQERALNTISPKTQTFSKYGRRLMQEHTALEENGLTTRNFEVHCPMVYNKKKLLRVLEKYPTLVMPRSLYGNEYKLKAIDGKDYKIEDNHSKISPEAPFASTSDLSFRNGEIGKQVRGLFTKPSEHEDVWAGLSTPPNFNRGQDLRFL